MPTTARPEIKTGDQISVRFLADDGEVNSMYTGTVTECDAHGVQLANVSAYDLELVTECGQPTGWYELSEVGLAWPRRGDVRVYRPHPADCVCSSCHDFS